MNSLGAIAVSGMGLAMTRATASAHNLANLPVQGFHRTLPVASARVGGGVEAGVVRAAQPGPAMAEDLLALRQAEHMFSANLAVFRAGDRMAGTLLDVLA